jgi:hypothetical protein
MSTSQPEAGNLFVGKRDGESSSRRIATEMSLTNRSLRLFKV